MIRSERASSVRPDRGEAVTPRRRRGPIAAIIAASVVACLPVAGSSGASVAPQSEPVGETTIATTPDTAAEPTLATATEVAGVEILPPDASWGGLTLGEWEARSLQWVLSLPEEVSPWFEATKLRLWTVRAGLLRRRGLAHRRVWWPRALRSTCGYRASVCSTVEPPPWFGRDEAELAACADDGLDGGPSELHASVNGQDVADLDAYRTTSPLFTVTFPEDNVIDVEPGVAHAISATYSFIIAPPPPGEIRDRLDSEGPRRSRATTDVKGHRHRRSTPGGRRRRYPDVVARERFCVVVGAGCDRVGGDDPRVRGRVSRRADRLRPPRSRHGTAEPVETSRRRSRRPCRITVGPRQPASPYYDDRQSILDAEVLEHFDIIGFDRRGTGGSNRRSTVSTTTTISMPAQTSPPTTMRNASRSSIWPRSSPTPAWRTTPRSSSSSAPTTRRVTSTRSAGRSARTRSATTATGTKAMAPSSAGCGRRCSRTPCTPPCWTRHQNPTTTGNRALLQAEAYENELEIDTWLSAAPIQAAHSTTTATPKQPSTN